MFQNAGQYATVLTHSKNKGKGCALKTGLAYIQEHFSEDYTVVTMDSDGQHTVGDALKLKDSCRVYKEILKFSASSFLSFLVDYDLYSLLLVLTGNLTASNIGARVVSAAVNYTVNRKLVFQSKSGIGWSAVQYVLLAAVVLAGNTLLLNALAGGLGMNRYFAKLLTELVFFLFSWLIQHFVIFRRKTKERESKR